MKLKVKRIVEEILEAQRLPDKPSELLILAMEDIERVEADPRYKIDMGSWHEPNGKCKVCAAGSVMAKTLKLPINVNSDYEGCHVETNEQNVDFDSDTERKLAAINSFRCGDMYDGFKKMNLSSKIPRSFQYFNEYGQEKTLEYGPLDPYDDHLDDLSQYNRKEWKAHMATIIGILQAEGL